MPVPGGPDPEDDVVLLDGVQVSALIDALGEHLPLPGRPRAAQEVLGKLDLVVLRHELRRRAHVALGQLVSAADQPRQLIQHALGPANVARFTLEDDLVPVGADANVELVFELLEVFVVVPEQGFDPLIRDGDLSKDGGGGYSCNSLKNKRIMPYFTIPA